MTDTRELLNSPSDEGSIDFQGHWRIERWNQEELLLLQKELSNSSNIYKKHLFEETDSHSTPLACIRNNKMYT